jgi:hypothetical protein
MNKNRILSILHMGKDYLNLYLKEMFLITTLKNIFDIKSSNDKFSYLTQLDLNDDIFINNILNSSLNIVDEDITVNEDLLLLYNKIEIGIEFTPNAKN